MSTPSVGGLLRRARLRLDLTLREVADAIGVSIAYVSDVELGRRELAPKRLPQFIKVLALTPKERAATYRAVGFLPSGVVERLLKAPELWDVDFVRLVRSIHAAVEDLDAAGRRATATSLRAAIRRKSTSSDEEEAA